MIKSLSIVGYRGFATKQTLDFAVPTGQPGSGLTTIVGANNGGKSTAAEALRALGVQQDVTFTVGKRNQKAGDTVELTLTSVDGEIATLRSRSAGTSETLREGSFVGRSAMLIVPSRRTFEPYFSKGESARDSYRGYLPSSTRSLSSDIFSRRLFNALRDQDNFNQLLKRVIDPAPDWTIDQNDNGQHFVKLNMNGATHNSEGAGEGFISLLFLIDALYDSKPGELIALDEPELSLHPAVQRRLSQLILEYSATRQIVIATHSPYFVNVQALSAGGRMVRAFRTDHGCEFAQLTQETGTRLYKASLDLNNPHLMGLDAREVFFLDDKIILVEGQEDVMFLGNAQRDVSVALNGTIFGWGSGGAEKMELIAAVLEELRFSKVVGILDADKAHLIPMLQERFKSYHFVTIPANDIRTKPEVKARALKLGLLDETNKAVRAEHRETFIGLIDAANGYFSN